MIEGKRGAREHHGVRADAQAQHADDELGGDAGLLGLQGLGLHQRVHVPVRLDALLPLPLPQLLQDLCTVDLAPGKRLFADFSDFFNLKGTFIRASWTVTRKNSLAI